MLKKSPGKKSDRFDGSDDNDDATVPNDMSPMVGRQANRNLHNVPIVSGSNLMIKSKKMTGLKKP